MTDSSVRRQPIQERVDELVSKFEKFMRAAVNAKQRGKYDSEESFRNKANEVAQMIVARVRKPGLLELLASQEAEIARLQSQSDAALELAQAQLSLLERWRSTAETLEKRVGELAIEIAARTGTKHDDDQVSRLPGTGLSEGRQHAETTSGDK